MQVLSNEKAGFVLYSGPRVSEEAGPLMYCGVKVLSSEEAGTILYRGVHVLSCE